MDLTLLRTFMAVYRAGSFTAGAAQVGLAQPTVTAQMRALESELGHQLFQRKARGIVPTSAAQELAVEVASHIDALEAVVMRGVAPRSRFEVPVHLAGPAEFIASWVLPCLSPLVDEGLQLRVIHGLSDELLSGLVAGRCDLVVSTIRPRLPSVSANALTDEEFVLVAGRAWSDRIDRDALASEGEGVLAQVPFVAYAEDLPLIRRYWRSVFGTKPRVKARVVVPDLRAVRSMTVAGGGITVLPRYLCRDELASGELTVLLEPKIPPINTIYLASRVGSDHVPQLSAVRSRLLEQARI